MEAQRMHHVHALTASVLLSAQGGVPSPEDQKNGGSCARRLADVSHAVGQNGRHLHCAKFLSTSRAAILLQNFFFFFR